MADSNDRDNTEAGGGGFMMGLLTGTVLGAGLGMLLAPKAGADLRGELGDQARNVGTKASEQYRRASETATGWAERGREMVNEAREVVTRGAGEAREAVTRGAGEAREAVTRGAEEAREAVTRGAEEVRGFAGGTNGSISDGTDYGRS